MVAESSPKIDLSQAFSPPVSIITREQRRACAHTKRELVDRFRRGTVVAETRRIFETNNAEPTRALCEYVGERRAARLYTLICSTMGSAASMTIDFVQRSRKTNALLLQYADAK